MGESPYRIRPVCRSVKRLYEMHGGARAGHGSDRRLRVCPALKLRAGDQSGIRPCDRQAATARFTPDVVPVRARQRHPHFQQGIRQVGEIPGGAVAASAIPGRLPHPSHAPNFRGESYRLRPVNAGLEMSHSNRAAVPAAPAPRVPAGERFRRRLGHPPVAPGRSTGTGPWNVPVRAACRRKWRV